MNNSQPVVLTIAGSDSGGGAGIQADLRAFNFFKVIGTTAITAITAQNPREITSILPTPASMVKKQIEAIFAEFAVHAIKIGMLVNNEIITTVIKQISSKKIPLIIDPIMVASSGKKLLTEDAIQTMIKQLLPLASIITPNIPEAELIINRKLESTLEIQIAAQELGEHYNCTVILKGGHSTKEQRDLCSTDIIYHQGKLFSSSTPILKPKSSHGTGCSLSAALAATLCKEDNFYDALIKAKAYLYGSLNNCQKCGPRSWIMQPPNLLPLSEVLTSPY